MRKYSTRRPELGFTLIEMLTVVGVIGVLAALATPPIYSYLRQYRIRAAVQDVTGNIQNARNRAIMKSANYGVDIVIQDASTYWLHMEDDQAAAAGRLSGARQSPNFTTPDQAQSIRYRLPDSVVFATAAQCTPAPAPSPAYSPNASGLRFSRLGAGCQPSSSDPKCPQITPSPAAALPSLLHNDATTGSTTICLRDTRTGHSLWLRVTAGGRIVGQR